MPRNRDRLKTNIVTKEVNIQNIPPIGGSCLVPPGPFFVSSGTKYEQMSDVVGRESSWQNPVSHVKILSEGAKLKSPGGGILISNHSVLDKDIILSTIPRPTPQQLADFSLWARQRAITAVDDGASLISFIGEMLETIEGSLTKIKKFADLWAYAVELFNKEYTKLIKNGVNQTSAYWIAWNFAIKPFIKDLKAIANSIRDSAKRLKWLQSRNGKQTFIKSRRSLDVASEGTSSNVGISTGVNGMEQMLYPIVYRYRVTENEWTAHTTSCVIFHIPPHLLENDVGFLITLFSKLGFYNPIKGLWQIVPYSWLVDWFMGYKTQLQLELTNFSPLRDADFLGAVSSLKCKTTLVVEQMYMPYPCPSIFDPPVDPTPQWNPIGEVKVEWYLRQPGEFDTSMAPAFNLPSSWYNISILASLGHQWWLRRR